MNQEKWLALTISLVFAPIWFNLGRSGALPDEPAFNFRRQAAISTLENKTETAGIQNGAFKARLNGVEISYTVAGRGPVLFVHGVGWGPDSRLYQNSLKFLETQFTLVYVDPRGTGNVEPIADTTQLSSARMADDLEALRQHLGMGRIALMGHAHGGFVAMKYALKYPKGLSHLILVSTILLRDLEADMRATNDNLQRHPRRKDATWEEALLGFKNEYDARTADEIRENMQLTGILYFYYYGSRQRANFEQAIKEAKFSANNFGQFVQKELLHYDLDGQESRVAASALLIYGLYDPYFIRSTARGLHWGIRNSKLELFERSGHYPWIEEPEHFARIIKAFLSPPSPVVQESVR
jgi:pimeloyl-ACP methyl ester carboxylesterase